MSLVYTSTLNRDDNLKLQGDINRTKQQTAQPSVNQHSEWLQDNGWMLPFDLLQQGCRAERITHCAQE